MLSVVLRYTDSDYPFGILDSSYDLSPNIPSKRGWVHHRFNGVVSRSLVFCSILLTIVCFLVLFHLTMVLSVLLFTPYILIPLISSHFFNEFSFPFSIIMAVVRVVVVDVIVDHYS